MAQIKTPQWREFRLPDRVLRAVFGAPLNLTAPDPTRLILWLPVALAAGSATYFSLTVEPDANLPVWMLFLGAVALVAAYLVRAHPGLIYVGVLVAASLSGFALAQNRAASLAPPEFTISERAVGITGWIEAVERGGDRPRLLIRVMQLEGASEPPKRIRVRVGLGDFQPGDGVRLRAVLSAPQAPVAPGGYDPARAAWFDQVALSGFAISGLADAQIDNHDRWARALARFRWELAERVRAQTRPRTGAVAAALLTGDRSSVAEDDAEALRVSGLGHILAISGLHMALFAGGIYMVGRLALASIEPYARAHDPRKPAALLALIAATGYLVLSGAAVSTQRAWVMAVVVLIGVMLDRRAFSMRSLALAGMVILILAPESIIEAGFQMSFAAVAALIAVYEVWREARPDRLAAPSWIGRLWAQMAGLTVTSLVAGAATGAFAAFHFQRMAAYGLIANILAMPIFTFWVMPAGVLALVLMPLGLEWPALFVMDTGLGLVLAIAHWTGGLSGAGVSVVAASGGVILLYGAGFAFATLGLGLVRLIGMGVGLLALFVWTQQSPPDIMISDSGVVVARFDGTDGFQTSSIRRARFDTRVFLQRAGQGQQRAQQAGLSCDTMSCTGQTSEGLVIAMTQSPEALAEDCQFADIVVFLGQASSWQKRRCRAILLDDVARGDLGGVEYFIEGGEVRAARAARDRSRNRPWAGTPQL